MMKTLNKILVYSILVAILYYLIDSFLDYLFFYDDSLFQIFITSVPINELYNRLIGITGIIIFGLIMRGFIHNLEIKREFNANKEAKKNSKKIFDISFISAIMHQIRTPLSNIVEFSDLLKDTDLTQQSKQLYINQIDSCGTYLLQLLNNIEDISKIESGQMVVIKGKCPVNKVLDEAYEKFEKMKRMKGKHDIALVMKKASKDENFTILTDTKRFKQLITNLFENALNYTEEGIIEFGYIFSNENHLQFYFKDTGIGFSGDQLEVIFHRYKKLTDNQNLPFDTSELRPAISKNIVKLLGGEIWADTKIGQGSTFYFSLPFNKVEIEPKEKIEKGKQDWKKYTILIVEDVESNYYYLEALLKRKFAKILWARNGKEAVDIYQKNRNIDIVLMDVLMPEMDGYEATEKFKKINKDIPVIALTAFSFEGQTTMNQLGNFDDFLTKPIWVYDLEAKLSKYLK